MWLEDIFSLAIWPRVCWSTNAHLLLQFTAPEQSGYVGFANLPNQVHRKSVKKGFEFTLMVVGKSDFDNLSLRIDSSLFIWRVLGTDCPVYYAGCPYQWFPRTIDCLCLLRTLSLFSQIYMGPQQEKSVCRECILLMGVSLRPIIFG